MDEKLVRPLRQSLTDEQLEKISGGGEEEEAYCQMYGH